MLLVLALSVWAYAAVRDVRERRVPNYVFGLLLALGLLRALTAGVSLLALSLSVMVLCPMAIFLWSRYDFGGADAKALMAGSILYPDGISLFLVGLGVGMLPWYLTKSDEMPMLVGFAFGAIVATVGTLL